MGIGSIFTSHEKLFANWMLQHEFNQEILAEPRFSGENQDEAIESYYTIQEKSPSIIPTEGAKEALRKIRLTQLNMPLEDEKEAVRKENLGVSGHPSILDFKVTNGAEIARQDKPVQKPIYQIVHGPVVQKVEKNSSVKDVQYGNFWGRTCFSATEIKQTGYFLVDGWLVVSVPENKKDNFYEINDDIDITIALKLDEGPDPVAGKIARYIQDWLMQQKEKLSIVSAASVAGATFFSVLAPRGKIDDLAGFVLTISCIAMYAMVFYSGLKLYQLHCFRDKLNSIKNLGDWVQQIRRSVSTYPDFFLGAPHVHKFFTTVEQLMISKNKDTSVTDYFRRFFQKNPGLLNISQVKV